MLTLVAYAVARWLNATCEGADFRIVIADGHFRMYRPGWRGTPLVEADLSCVRHLHWYVSPFSHQQTVRVLLWDRPSTFTLQGVDVGPDDPAAQELGWFRAPDLLLQPRRSRSRATRLDSPDVRRRITRAIQMRRRLSVTSNRISRTCLVSPVGLAFQTASRGTKAGGSRGSAIRSPWAALSA